MDDIKRIQEYAVYNIAVGDVFYRARLFEDPLEYYKDEFEQISTIIQKHFPNTGKKESLINVTKPDELLTFLAALLYTDVDIQPFYCEIEQIFNKEKLFWGYDAKGSDAPPASKTPAGRANPSGISYLYISDDIKTAMMEVRPNLYQTVSIATIEIKKELRVFDFCYIVLNETDIGKNFDLSIIASQFSAPNYGGAENYYATQYLCEFIKELGFDGIRFTSSLNPEGKNIVLFDTNEDPITNCKNYTIKESKVYSVQKLDLNYQMIAPAAQEDTPKTWVE